MDKRWVDDVLTRHPRHSFKRHLIPAWKAEGKAMPQGRARWLTTYARMPLLVKLAPFPE